MNYQLVQYVIKSLNVHQGGYSFTCLAERVLIKWPQQDLAEFRNVEAKNACFSGICCSETVGTNRAHPTSSMCFHTVLSSVLSAHVCIFSASNLLPSLWCCERPNLSCVFLFLCLKMIFLKVTALLFPTSDFRHPVTTPALLYIGQTLTRVQATHRLVDKIFDWQHRCDN